jgi:hypothetical protein
VSGLPKWIQEIAGKAAEANAGTVNITGADGIRTTHIVRGCIPKMAEVTAAAPRLIGLVERMAEVLDKIAWEYAAELGCAYLDDNPDACLACEAHEYCPGCGAAQVLAEYRGEMGE